MSKVHATHCVSLQCFAFAKITFRMCRSPTHIYPPNQSMTHNFYCIFYAVTTESKQIVFVWITFFFWYFHPETLLYSSFETEFRWLNATVTICSWWIVFVNGLCFTKTTKLLHSNKLFTFAKIQHALQHIFGECVSMWCHHLDDDHRHRKSVFFFFVKWKLRLT